ncbi:MAG: UDP-N-acetylglucosamine 1-carboxyvinyltransferase [Thermoanaerobaculia bacterium]|nr:UDP-N-acetylglucosamine 1-carboxyvinyltransferase [Thermoanaerobaculia bacterium]
MDKFKITGPSQLRGTVRASGAKNAALPALTVSLLTDQALTLDRVPAVRDLKTLRDLLQGLGIESQDGSDGSLRLQAGDDLSSFEAPYDLVKKMRASILVLGPLTARRGRAKVSLPGGCAIGVRPIDQHIAGLRALGAEVELEHGYVLTHAKRLQGTRFSFSLPTVTGTENLMMAACLAKGETVLENCAREPEIENLADLLVTLGAQIEGAGTPTIHIQGVDELGTGRHEIIADRIEGGTYLIGAAMTRGDVRLEGARPEHLMDLIEALEDVGASVTTGDDWIRVEGVGDLVARDISTAPHPGFPTDLQAQFMALLTQTRGVSRVHETIFENRFQHVAELLRMGADIHVEEHTATVSGPTQLSGADVMATDLRASASLVLAGLVAHGVTEVSRIYHLDRGYDAMERKLESLGARVERIPGPPTP